MASKTRSQSTTNSLLSEEWVKYAALAGAFYVVLQIGRGVTDSAITAFVNHPTNSAQHPVDVVEEHEHLIAAQEKKIEEIQAGNATLVARLEELYKKQAAREAKQAERDAMAAEEAQKANRQFWLDQRQKDRETMARGFESLKTMLSDKEATE